MIDKNDKHKFLIHKYWTDILAIVLIAVTVECNTLLLNFPFFRVYKRFFFFNFCLWFLIFKFFQAIINNYWTLITLTISLNCLFLFGTILKIKFRNEPILPADVKMIENLPSLLKMIPILVVIFFLVIIIILVIICIILNKNFKISKLSTRSRIFWVLMSIIVFGSSLIWNKPDTVGNKLVTYLIQDPMFWDQTRGAEQHGPLIQFLRNVDMSIMSKPVDYSEQKIGYITKNIKM